MCLLIKNLEFKYSKFSLFFSNYFPILKNEKMLRGGFEPLTPLFKVLAPPTVLVGDSYKFYDFLKLYAIFHFNLEKNLHEK